MTISLKPQHLNRYRQIAWLFMKYGRSDLVKASGLDETLNAEQRVAPQEAAKAEELAKDLEKLGPTFAFAFRAPDPGSTAADLALKKRFGLTQKKAGNLIKF